MYQPLPDQEWIISFLDYLKNCQIWRLPPNKYEYHNILDDAAAKWIKPTKELSNQIQVLESVHGNMAMTLNSRYRQQTESDLYARFMWHGAMDPDSRQRFNRQCRAEDRRSWHKRLSLHVHIPGVDWTVAPVGWMLCKTSPHITCRCSHCTGERRPEFALPWAVGAS